MSVYFIHAEVLNGGNVVTKLCAVVVAADQKEHLKCFSIATWWNATKARGVM